MAQNNQTDTLPTLVVDLETTEPSSLLIPSDHPSTAPAGKDGARSMGTHAPLNSVEALKQADGDPLGVRKRILDIYSRQGFDSIPVEDRRVRFRWWGLYTQRAPGLDGLATGTASDDELEAPYFMLRVRTDGGALTVAQAKAMAAVSTRYGRDTADISDRQNIQLHWIRVEDVPAIWSELEAVGLHSTEACGDTPRVVLGSPVAGVAADEIIDGTPAINTIVEQYVGDPELADLPRKFKTAISGNPRLDVWHEINDVSFVGVQHPQLGPGFDLWVGGGLSTNPMLAVRLGAFVTLEQVPTVWLGVIRLFAQHGYRGKNRIRSRLKFLVNDWGAATFRRVLEDDYLGYALPDGPAPLVPDGARRDHVGVHAQHDGRFYVGVAPIAGRITGTMLTEVAELTAAAGSDLIRFTPEQKLVVLDVAANKVDDLVAGLEKLDLTVYPSEFRRGVMACTGIEFCKLAIVETKAHARATVIELERRMPQGPGGALRIHVNGCPNSCARIQVADIGLKGQILTTKDGRRVEGFQVHLGGEARGGSADASADFGRKPRGLKATAEQLPDLVENLVRSWQSERTIADNGIAETFASWVRRADDATLSTAQPSTDEDLS